MCRWTKAMLRGLGGCYKHTFYGIQSHQCMEMTPSMACANKCVFCWRHHKNPVGKEWRWEMDPPEMLIEQGLQNHYKMINEYKGAKGVWPERVAEGFNVKHCALSLVGEPVLYPEINPFLGMLHDRGISSFMVTNAQFPDLIATLRPVTQLYLSIDAATPESLKKIDRPLFEDYWERFLGSIDALREKGQRTVFRLTLVKGYNTEEIKNYAALIRRGQPDFIEIKGVTFCGGGKRAELSMKNVPWHEEVIEWAQILCREVADTYELACEHEHSCCLLLANVAKFKVEGRWHTFIDFDKFIRLQAAGKPFTSLDYMLPTPDWALWGSSERGFDPQEQRVRRKGKARSQSLQDSAQSESDTEEYQQGGC